MSADPQQQQKNNGSDSAFKLALDDHVLRMLLGVHPWPETVAALHEQFAQIDSSKADGKAQADKLQYLVEKVFPTLIPAVNDLSEVVRRDVDARSGHPAAPPAFPPTRCSPAIGEGQFAATGIVHPVVWLAQRLLRGGGERGVTADQEHALCELLRRAPPSASRQDRAVAAGDAEGEK